MTAREMRITTLTLLDLTFDQAFYYLTVKTTCQTFVSKPVPEKQTNCFQGVFSKLFLQTYGNKKQELMDVV